MLSVLDKNSKTGFSLLELLVVISIIGILVGVTTASFSESRAYTRDSERQTALKELQLAVEQYRLQTGSYPAMGCGTATGTAGVSVVWAQAKVTGCNGNFIQGLTPDYLRALPVDPNQGTANDLGFMYLTDNERTAYKIMVYGTVEADEVANYNHPFARCPRSFGSINCGDPLAATTRITYAVYSPGAEAW